MKYPNPQHRDRDAKISIAASIATTLIVLGLMAYIVFLTSKGQYGKCVSAARVIVPVQVVAVIINLCIQAWRKRKWRDFEKRHRRAGTLSIFLLFTLSLNAQTPNKVSIYQPDDVKLHTKRKPPLTVDECIGFLQANAPQVFQFRSMMGADTIRTTVEIQDTVHRTQYIVHLGTIDTMPPTPDPVDAWAFLSPTKPVTYSTKVRYVRTHDTIWKTKNVYRDFLMHRDTVLLPCQDSPKASTFDGKAGLIASFIMGIIALIVAIYAYKKGKKDGHSLNRNV